jgi:hypothetical protein
LLFIASSYFHDNEERLDLEAHSLVGRFNIVCFLGFTPPVFQMAEMCNNLQASASALSLVRKVETCVNQWAWFFGESKCILAHGLLTSSSRFFGESKCILARGLLTSFSRFFRESKCIVACGLLTSSPRFFGVKMYISPWAFKFVLSLFRRDAKDWH